MPAFSFKALDKSGKQHQGIIEADHARHVREQLREKNWVPLEIQISQSNSGDQKLSELKLFSTRETLKTHDLSLITRELATLVKASLPLEEALKAIADQHEKSKIKNIIIELRARILEGHTLAHAMARFPRIFDNLYRSMVQAGERAGELGEVLVRLADYTESRHQMRQQVLTALLYPLILTITALLVVSGLLAYVVPEVVTQFESMGRDLPPLTEFMITLSDFIRQKGLIVLIALILIWLSIQFALKKSPAFQKRLHGLNLKLPLIGKLARIFNIARFSRTLWILRASNVPMLESLQIAGQVLTNQVLTDAVIASTHRVREGASLQNALKESGQFPPLLLHMIGSGEKSGELEQMLARIAENQEQTLSGQLRVLLGVFEPLLILLMGGFVLLIVMAILLPIFELNQLIG